MNKDIMYREKQGFSMGMKEKWIYEDDLVNCTAAMPDERTLALTGAMVKSVCKDTNEIILEKDQMSYRISLYNVGEIALA